MFKEQLVEHDIRDEKEGGLCARVVKLEVNAVNCGAV